MEKDDLLRSKGAGVVVMFRDTSSQIVTESYFFEFREESVEWSSAIQASIFGPFQEGFFLI